MSRIEKTFETITLTFEQHAELGRVAYQTGRNEAVNGYKNAVEAIEKLTVLHKEMKNFSGSAFGDTSQGLSISIDNILKEHRTLFDAISDLNQL